MRKFFGDYRVFLFLVASIWSAAVVNAFFDNALNDFALIPRQYEKIYGVVSMHFLHANFGHLVSNTIPLLLLGFMVTALGNIWRVTLIVMIVCGSLVWIFARDGLHLGASGLVMGYWGYLISNAVFCRSLKSIFIAIVALFLYGGSLYTLLDFRPVISFEAHLSGFLSGVVAAKYLLSRNRQKS